MKFKVEGAEEVARQITSLTDDKMKVREIRKVLRRQSKPILRAVKAATPIAKKPITVRGEKYLPQNLKKSMAIKTGKSKTYPNVLVGPRMGKKYKNDGFYIYFLQYGTNKIQGDDFIGRAASPLLPSVNRVMSSDLKKYIEKKAKTLKI